MRDRPATVAASLPTLDSRLCPVSSCGGARDSSDAPVGARCDLTDDPHVVAAASRQKLERLRSQRGGVRKHRSYRVVSMSRRILFVRVSWSSGRLVVVFYESCSVQSSFDQCPLGHRAAPRGVAAIRPRNVRAAPRGVKRRNASFQKTRLPPSRASSRRAPRADGKLLGAARVVDGAESIAVSSRGAVRAASRERVVRTGVAGRDDRMVAQRRQRSDLWAASSDALTSPPGRRGEGSRASGPRIAVRRVQNAFEPLFLRRPPGDVSSEGAAAVAALPQGPWAALRAFRVTAFTEI